MTSPTEAPRTAETAALIRAHARCHGSTCTGTDDGAVCRPHADGAGWDRHEAAAPASPDVVEALRAIEQVLNAMDWLGTGSNQESADEDEREAWEHWTVIRRALAALPAAAPAPLAATPPVQPAETGHAALRAYLETADPITAETALALLDAEEDEEAATPQVQADPPAEELLALLALAYDDERNYDPNERTEVLLDRCLSALGYRLAAAKPEAGAGLRDAVQRLVDADDIDMNCGWDSPSCHFCNVETYSSENSHADNCPWAALKHSLAATPAAKPEGGAGLDEERLAEALGRLYDDPVWENIDPWSREFAGMIVATYAEAASPRSDAGSEADNA